MSLWGTLALGAFAVSGGMHDLTTSGSSAELNDGARIEQSFLSVVGTGYLDSFLRVQAKGVEDGYNTSHRLGGVPKIVYADDTATDDVTDGQFTRGLRLSDVPTVVVDGKVYREFRLDLNEDQAKGYLLSLDGAGVWLGSHEFINYFDPVTGTYVHFSSSSDPDSGGTGTANLVWALEQDWWVKMNSSLSSGSGQLGDARLLVPAGLFGGADQVCAYDHGEPCDVFVYFDTLFGEHEEAEATFEEWAVRVVPYITKTVETSLTRTWEWTIEKSVSPEAWDLNTGDSGTSQYEVTVTKGEGVDSGWTVSGEITITNPGKEVDILSVEDVIDGAVEGAEIEADVECPVTFPYTLGSGNSLVCAYTATADAEDDTNPFGDTNTATFQYSQGKVVETGIVVEEVDFGAATVTDVNGTINVSDSVQGALGSASEGTTFTYTDTFTCDDDEGENGNIATIVETGQAASATVTVNCYTPTVTKTAVERLTRTWEWTIDKSVSPEVWDLNTGDSGTSGYEVTVEKTGFTDSGWTVEGEITINNPNPTTALDITEIVDEINPDGITATVDCGGFTQVVPGGSITCDYGPVDLPDGSDRTNTATATHQNYSYDESLAETADGTSDVSGDAEVDFSEAVVTDVDGTIEVTDSVQGALGSASDDRTFTYTDTFTCDDDAGENDNTATIVETGQTAEATVTVNCYTPTVTKTADESLTRTWTWTIDKVGDQTALTLMPGQAFWVNYQVEVGATFLDSDWSVSGEIKVENPNPSLALDVTGVTDVVDGVGLASVSCPGSSIEAGGSMTCSYGPLDLPDAESRLNTATAVYRNNDYDVEGTATESGTSEVSGSAEVEFSDPVVTHVDEEITVVDDNATPEDPTDDVVLGTVNALTDTLPKVFSYGRFIGPYGELECGEVIVVNIASFVTNDTESTGSDDHTIVVTIPCPQGCTLTQGYWKTHNDSFRGGAPADDAWYLIGDVDGDGVSEGERETFFNSGQTWFEVYWTAPSGGNAYYQLAHQYMAARLNILNGASAPAEVTDAIGKAEDWFANTANTPESTSLLKGKQAKEVRDLASLFASYNEGRIGPGHCSEDATSNLTQ